MLTINQASPTTCRLLLATKPKIRTGNSTCRRGSTRGAPAWGGQKMSPRKRETPSAKFEATKAKNGSLRCHTAGCRPRGSPWRRCFVLSLDVLVRSSCLSVYPIALLRLFVLLVRCFDGHLEEADRGSQGSCPKSGGRSRSEFVVGFGPDGELGPHFWAGPRTACPGGKLKRISLRIRTIRIWGVACGRHQARSDGFEAEKTRAAKTRIWTLFGRRLRCSRSRCDPTHRVGTLNIVCTAGVGDRKTEYRSTPSPKRPSSGRKPADRISDRRWTTPQIDSRLKPHFVSCPLEGPDHRTRDLLEPDGRPMLPAAWAALRGTAQCGCVINSAKFGPKFCRC